MNINFSYVIRGLIAAVIVVSILVTFYSKIILKDYEIIQNEDGPSMEE